MGAFLTRRRLLVAIALAVVATAAVVLAIALAGGGGDSAPATETSASVDPAPVASPSDSELDDLVNGVILAGFEGTDPGSEIIGEVTDHQLGGVLVGSDNWAGKGPGEKLLGAIRDAGSTDDRLPPLIAVAQEGGPYRVLEDLPPEEREVEIGKTADPEAAATWMGDSAKALRDVGFDLDLAPVADVATLDSPIADRAFSDDADIAAQMTAAAVRACADEGIACAPAHFPGLGGANQSTDIGPASVGIDAATLAGRDLLPFRAAFDAGAPAVVISSAFYTAYDPVTPASLTPAITTNLLRDEEGFEGVAISDDLSGGAIEAVNTPADAAVEAIGAGIDLVRVTDPGDVDDVRKALKQAIDDGTLGVERLAEAADRVEDLKKSLADEGK